MSKIDKLLSAIEKCPGMYLGTTTITGLKAFLEGYTFALHEIGDDTRFYPGFNEYIAAKYKITSSHDWSRIILSFSSSEEEAFRQFYRLLDEYKKTINR